MTAGVWTMGGRVPIPDGEWWPTPPRGWQLDAECAGLPPEPWFTDPGDVDHFLATAVCVDCPVRAQCLAAAMNEEPRKAPADARFGIRGATTPEEREVLATRTRANRRPPRTRPRKRAAA